MTLRKDPDSSRATCDQTLSHSTTNFQSLKPLITPLSSAGMPLALHQFFCRCAARRQPPEPPDPGHSPESRAGRSRTRPISTVAGRRSPPENAIRLSDVSSASDPHVRPGICPPKRLPDNEHRQHSGQQFQKQNFRWAPTDGPYAPKTEQTTALECSPGCEAGQDTRQSGPAAVLISSTQSMQDDAPAPMPVSQVTGRPSPVRQPIAKPYSILDR